MLTGGMNAPILPPSDTAIDRAVDVLRAGGLVAVPTETVYGLACDAANPEAVARLYGAKGRPRFNPLIAHVAPGEMGRRQVRFNAVATSLADRFWPGPLTLVLSLAASHTVCDLARAGLETLAVRTPAHPLALDVITGFGGPIVAPSANPSGKLSPTTAQHVAADMGDRIDLILDGGGCSLGLESTIIDCTSERPAPLRAGAIDIADIEAVTGPLARPEHNPEAPTAPGQLLRHYAPDAALRLNVTEPADGEAWLGFGPECPSTALNLSETGTLTEAAANLFAMLRALDAVHARIAVAPIPNTGLGEAINDRLHRAAQR